jgi:hypothetical protein
MERHFNLFCSFMQAVVNTAGNFMFCEKGVMSCSAEGLLVFEEGLCRSSVSACGLVVTNGEKFHVTKCYGVTRIKGTG